jgi:very-short-patch-repair endonuclease
MNVSQVLARQDGAVSLAQLEAAGVNRGSVAHQLANGRLRRVYRGVFIVAPFAGPRAVEHAALLAGGEYAVLSHNASGTVWEIAAPSTEVDLTLRTGARRHQPGLRFHRSPLSRADWCERDGLRLTTPARTVLDLATRLNAGDLARLVNEVQVQRLATERALHDAIGRSPRHRGVNALRRALADEPRLTRSELERHMLALVRRIGLPEPLTNARVLGYEVDFLWPHHRVVVETDGYAAHHTRARFESDRARDAALQAAGYRVLRFSWRQLIDAPEVIAARLAATITRAGV